MLHRNSQKRFYGTELVYFVTTKTKDNFPFFEEPIFCELWLEELKLCKELKEFELYAFGLGYDHFHLVVKPAQDDDISKVVQSLKRNFARDANRVLLDDRVESAEGEIPKSRLGGIKTTKEGGNPEGDNLDCRLLIQSKIYGINRMIKKFNAQFIQKYKNQQNHFPLFSWQRSFHDHVIRNQKDFKYHINYTTYNFLKHNLPENWRYTSLNFPELLDWR